MNKIPCECLFLDNDHYVVIQEGRVLVFCGGGIKTLTAENKMSEWMEGDLLRNIRFEMQHFYPSLDPDYPVMSSSTLYEEGASNYVASEDDGFVLEFSDTGYTIWDMDLLEERGYLHELPDTLPEGLRTALGEVFEFSLPGEYLESLEAAGFERGDLPEGRKFVLGEFEIHVLSKTQGYLADFYSHGACRLTASGNTANSAFWNLLYKPYGPSNKPLYQFLGIDG